MARAPSRPQEAVDDINNTVRDNLRRILAGQTPEAYCKGGGRPLYYVTGDKKGKKVAARALRYAIQETDPQSPRLDLIAAVAAREGIPAYVLLIPHGKPAVMRRWDDFPIAAGQPPTGKTAP